MRSETCINIFQQCISDYHLADNVDAYEPTPYAPGGIEAVLYKKCWIDTVQWHLEDIIRNPAIDPAEALLLKRRIDKSNQHRTDMVEQIDDWFLNQYINATQAENAKINTESPAWAIDRLSILELKIYHMQAEAERAEASEEHKAACSRKLGVLREQRADLSQSIDELLQDIAEGRKKMKVYRQMKMYNDASLNPVLYGQQKAAH